MLAKENLSSVYLLRNSCPLSQGMFFLANVGMEQLSHWLFYYLPCLHLRGRQDLAGF